MVNDSIKLRCTFNKVGRAKFISHLDLYRTMQRAFKRAKIPLWYTQGFNPHAYIMFPLALSLGVESRVEIMDFNITEFMDYDEIKKRFNDVLPQDISITKVYEPCHKHTDIGLSEYKMLFSAGIADLKSKFDEFMAQGLINVEKKTKKKSIINIDIKQFIEVVSCVTRDEIVEVDILLPSGVEFNLNPTLVTGAFEQFIGCEVDIINIQRTRILCNDKTEFC